jgi:hypothetical protein
MFENLPKPHGTYPNGRLNLLRFLSFKIPHLSFQFEILLKLKEDMNVVEKGLVNLSGVEDVLGVNALNLL